MRYYWEALFSTEYFPFWEFTMLMFLVMNLSMIIRLHRIEKSINILNEIINDYLDITDKY